MECIDYRVECETVNSIQNYTLPLVYEYQWSVLLEQNWWPLLDLLNSPLYLTEDEARDMCDFYTAAEKLVWTQRVRKYV